MKKVDFKELRTKTLDWFKDIKILIKENKRIAFIIMGFVALVALAIVLTTVVAKKNNTAEVVLATEDATEAEEYVIPDEPLEVDAYPEINNLMKKYYQAVADGDVETIKSIKTAVDEKESIVIKKKSQYIDSYPVVTCYTKKGSLEDTFLVFAYYEVKIVGYDKQAPGLNAWYVCKNENGEYYINDDEQDETLAEYCKIISVQDDVVDLNNTVNVKFNEMLEEDTEFAKFMTELPDKLTAEVGEELARIEAGETIEEPSETEEETETETEEAVEKKVRITADVVNVRSSDSSTADKLGTARHGEEYTLVEEKVNGWSKIIYEDKEAFISSEYVEVISEEPAEASNEDTASNDSDNKNNKDNSSKDSNSNNNAATDNSPTTGTAKVNTTVKFRKDASASSEQLGVIYGGGKVEVVEKKSNGWTKIKYNGQTGYVKSEYLE